MPTWNQINSELDQLVSGTACDQIRKKYLSELAAFTSRPTIAYYSGFLQKRNPDGRYHPESAITDHDMNGMMAACHKMDRANGLDLLLHTPGGGIEATRAIVEYLYKVFGVTIRVIVPQIAMSAGTMIACAANEVVMGKHSCLGPTDPQIHGLAALGILAEAEQAIAEIKAEPARAVLWQAIFNKYPPAFISDCKRSVEGTRAMVRTWLKNGMLRGESNPEEAATYSTDKLMDYGGTSGHDHHFLIDKCRSIGLKIVEIEDDQTFQDKILSVHHSFMATFARTTAIKVVENSIGSAWIVNT